MNFLAFDLGATSGRAILGIVEDGRLSSEEIYRFPNAVKEDGGKNFWAIYSLFDHFKAALTKMPIGSTWEVVIPQQLAYGENSAPGSPIKPFSTLIFKIETISIEK